MSYARWGWDGSDVYVYLSTSGHLECCGCRLGAKHDDSPFHDSQSFDTTDAMIAHLHEHIAVGHCVPPDVIPELEADREENELYLRGDAA